MSDTTENTNELDSYGVWVKNNNQEEAADDLNFAESLDLPDFEESDSIEDSDFSDMFNEDDTVNLDTMSDDTTLTDDELMNITSGDGIQIEEAPAESSDIEDISFDSLEENSVSDADLSGFEDTAAEETPAEPTDDSSMEEMNVEDFGVDSAADTNGNEEEISLDDFMDSGFSDESVASGNNGFAADSAPASESEDVALDDFVDMSEFGMEEEAPKKEEAIVDEKPLDMDISFDSSADTIQTEENDNEQIVEDEGFGEDEFAVQKESEEETQETVESGNDIESEEVDLSDFGIDADAEETPVTQDVEGAKSKESVVDYDLSVGGNENMNAAPVVNEIKSNDIEEIQEVEAIAEEIPEEVEEAVSEEASSATPVDNSLLQQIVADLSNLKEEINTLKNNLEEMKASPAPAAESSGIIEEEIAIDETEDEAKEDTGFFSGDDGDDTIALSTDELSNILNTADFSEAEASEDTGIEDEAPVEEAPAEEPVVEEETPFEENDVEVGEEIPEEAIGAISDESNDIAFDFEEENLSEPNLDDIEIDEEALEDDLPDEIEISKEDDILVESSSSDFMDSVQDTTDEHQPEEGVIEEVATEEAPVEEDAFSTVDNLFDDNASEPVEEEPVEETVEEEPVVVEESVEEEEPEIVEEPVIEDETFVEEPVTEEPVAEDNSFIDDAFVTHEDDNNDLTDSNIDYLTTEEEKADEPEDENAELKKDIKSVLLYMDQLLENLPEDKIVEFAKSDEFTTYKKLFSELGLS